MTQNNAIPFNFSVNQFTTQPWTFEQDIENYTALGVRAIEICELKLDDKRLERQLAMVKDHGLTISAVQPLVRTFGASKMQPEPTILADRVARLHQSIERIAPFAPGCPFVVNTGSPEKGNINSIINNTVGELKALAEFATDHGVRIALEPLNATSMNTETAIWTINQALNIIDAVGQNSVGLCLDFWNIWQDAGLQDEIKRASGRIFVLQVSDWREPRSSGDRLIPGDGIMPIGDLLHQVHKAGYSGACTVEIFSQDVADSLYKGDLNEVIIRSRNGLEKAWKEHHVKELHYK